MQNVKPRKSGFRGTAKRQFCGSTDLAEVSVDFSFLIFEFSPVQASHVAGRRCSLVHFEQFLAADEDSI